MNKRNYKFNAQGGVDCEVELNGEWLPHTLEHIPVDVEVAAYEAPQKTKLGLIAEVAAKRYEVETRGILRGGIRINTERITQSMVTGAYQALSTGMISSTNWKNDDGTFTQVTLETLQPLAGIIAQHVAACFTAEMDHQIAIYAIEDQALLNNYDISQGWPS